MSEQTLPAADRQNQPVVMARIECGCGFTVEGFDEQCNAAAFDSHGCFYESETEGLTWHQSVFSMWGLLIALVVVSGVVSIALGEVAW